MVDPPGRCLAKFGVNSIQVKHINFPSKLRVFRARIADLYEATPRAFYPSALLEHALRMASF